MTLLILGRAVLSASGSAVQKLLLLRGLGSVSFWLVTYGLMTIPAVLLVCVTPWIGGPEFWISIVLGGVLDAAGNLAMIAALRRTDLSIFGPLNALRPVLALGFGAVFLGEMPTRAGLAGLGTIVLGGILLFSRSESAPALSQKEWEEKSVGTGGERTHAEARGRGEETGSQLERSVMEHAPWWRDLRNITRPLLLRLAGLGLSAWGAVYLKRAALLSSVESTLAVWIMSGFLSLAAYAILFEKKVIWDRFAGLHGNLKWIFFHTAVFFTMQWMTIEIFSKTLLAYSFAYFQLGMALQVVMGRVFFNEPAFGRRLAGCFVMGSGSALIAWKG